MIYGRALPSSAQVGGMVLPMTIPHADGTAAIGIAYRDDFCAHVRLGGDFPSRPNEVAL